MRVCVSGIALVLAACNAPPPVSHEPPASVEHPVPESELARVRLTDAARERLGVTTGAVGAHRGAARRRMAGEIVVPPGRSVTLTAPVAGVVRARTAPRPGASVERGEDLYVLTPLAPVDRDTRARAAREVEAAEATLAAAEARLERTETLAQSRAGSRRAIEEATAARAIARADVDAARARARSVRSTPLLADVRMRVTAPEGGVIARVLVVPGQSVVAGAPLVEIAAVADLWVRVPVPSAELATLDSEASATVEPLGVGAGSAAEARPVAGPLGADPVLGTVDRYYALTEGSFTPGQRVLVSLASTSLTETRAAPFSAVFHDAAGSAWVYVVEEDGVYHRARVDVVGRDGELAVLARGPAEGTEVVAVGAAEIYGTEFEPGH